MDDKDTATDQGKREEEFSRRVLSQAFELWIDPEIERRRALGLIPDSFQLLMAQRLQRPDGTIEIRINEEVRGVATATANRPVSKGSPVYLEDFDSLEQFELTDEDLDSGHWTVIYTGKRWFTSFNFLSNRSKCLDLTAKACQFINASRLAVLDGAPAVAVDTLFSACELLSKAELVASNVIPMEAKTHGVISGNINRWRKAGNVDTAFVDLFNRMRDLRPLYRYDAEFSEKSPVSEDDLELASAMASHLRARLAAKVESTETASEQAPPPSHVKPSADQ